MALRSPPASRPPDAADAAPAGVPPGPLSARRARLADELREALARDAALAPPGPGERLRALLGRGLARHRRLRRLLNHVAGAVLLLPPLHYLLTPLGFAHWGSQALLAALFGATVALLRPRGLVVGALLALTGLATLLLCDGLHALPDLLAAVLALLTYFGLGLALGIVENVVHLGE